jgi:hypothetical protein
MLDMETSAAQDLHEFLGRDKFGCILAESPWRFRNRTGNGHE